MEYKRELDLLIAKFVYNEEVYALLESYGNRIDYVAKNKKSQANEPLYAMDMVDDYILKNFSNNISHTFSLIPLINEKNFLLSFDQKKFTWSGEINSRDLKVHISECYDLKDLICLFVLRAFSYDIKKIKNFKFKVEETKK